MKRVVVTGLGIVSPIGNNAAEKRRKEILDAWPMIMFWGLPTRVATLPIFALIARASK